MIPRDIQEVTALLVVAVAAVVLVLRFVIARRRERACETCAFRSASRESANPPRSGPLASSHPEKSR